MKSRYFVVGGMFAAGVVLIPGMTDSQDYPTKPIRLVTTSAGGGTDTVVRIIAPGVASALGQPVIVENRGGGIAPGDVVSKAPPDGYTLLVYNAIVWAAQFFQNVPYDGVKDFAPVTLLTRSPSLVVVHPSLPVKSIKELIALAKARPGELNYASGPTGSTGHLATEQFKSMAGVNIVRIPYSSNAGEDADMLSGRLQLIFSSPSSVVAHLKSGKLRALAVTSARRSPLFPEMPAVAETLPGFESGSILGMWVPARTPDAIVKRLSQETARFLNTAEVKQKLLGRGLEAVGSTPEEFDAVIKADFAALNKMAKAGVFK